MGRPRNQINDATLSSKISFSENQNIPLNERFTVYTTSLMSAEQIANGFFFNKEVIKNNINDLNLLPVVGYYDETKEDFKGHEVNTRPFGAVVPNTARFETLDDKEYLVVEVAVWSARYPEVKDLTKQNQSLELVSISGKYNSNNKCYEVDGFKFDAICILGEDVKPAWEKARMDIDSHFTDEFEEFKQDFSQFLKDINNEEKKGEEVQMENEKLEFTLSHETVRDKIFSAMNPVNEEGYRDFNYFVCEVKDDCFVCMDCGTWENYYKFNYSVDAETGNVTVDMESKKEAYPTFMSMEEINMLDEAKASKEQQFSEMEQELGEMKEKYADIEGKFSSLSEKYADLEGEKANMSLLINELEAYKTEKEEAERLAFEELQKEEVKKVIETFASRLTAEEIDMVIGTEREGLIASEVKTKLAVAFSEKELAKENKVEQPKVFANIESSKPLTVSVTDRLIEEAKAKRNQ